MAGFFYFLVLDGFFLNINILIPSLLSKKDVKKGYVNLDNSNTLWSASLKCMLGTLVAQVKN